MARLLLRRAAYRSPVPKRGIEQSREALGLARA